MPKQRYVDTDFWDDKWVRSLPKDGKHLFMYFLTNPKTNIAGVYRITTETMSHDTAIDEDDVKDLIWLYTHDGKAFMYHEEWLALVNSPKHQKIRERDNNRQGVNRILLNLPDDVWDFIIACGYKYKFINDIERNERGASKPLASPLKPLVRGSNYSYSYSDLYRDSHKDLYRDDSEAPSKPLEAPSKPLEAPSDDEDVWEQVTTGDPGEDSDTLTSQFHDKIKGGPT